VDVPVQLIVPERDPFVTPEFAVGSAQPWARDLTVHRRDAGHWLMHEDPKAVAGTVDAFIQRCLQPTGRPSSSSVPSNVST
jgi:pimeloyl-ACP methyl ester carboxylesterase